MDAELSFRVTDTSLDPYLRVIQPTLSPYTTAVASGTIRVVGELYNPDALRVDTNGRASRRALVRLPAAQRSADPLARRPPGRCRSTHCKLVGEDTELELTGTVNLTDQSLALQANGAANLAVLQGFLPDVRSSGRAEVTARISGTAHAPVVAGNALLTNGRIRHCRFRTRSRTSTASRPSTRGPPSRRITARLGGGPVRFGGRIGMSGYQLSEFDVTATGEDMRLRFPEGMRSIVDAELALRGRRRRRW